MSQIFISYSRRDWAIAEGLAENLHALGYSVWIDTKIDPNVPYAPEIASALQSARAIIVIWSGNSIASEWVRWEAGEALKASKLLQLRVPDLPVEQVPEPFKAYTIYSEGGPEDVRARIEALSSTGGRLPAIEFSNPIPDRPVRQPSETYYAPQGSSYLYSIVAFGAGLLVYPLQPQLGSLLAAAAIITGIALVAYSVYFSISRFADRFGRRLMIESLVVGLVAGAFAGIAGGYPYAARLDRWLAGAISQFDFFSIKYIRVIVISGIVGTVLSYFVMAMLRYARLRERNLGPMWSRRNVSLHMAVPAALAIVLTVGTALLADNLPRIGQLVEIVTLGRIDWIGSGQCPSIRMCREVPGVQFCTKCSVGEMSKIDITLVLAIYLWTLHVYHLKQAGGRLGRILVSSGVLTVAVLAVMFAFQTVPEGGDREPIVLGWSTLLFVFPWIVLIFAAVLVIYGNARAIERGAILSNDR